MNTHRDQIEAALDRIRQRHAIPLQLDWSCGGFRVEYIDRSLSPRASFRDTMLWLDGFAEAFELVAERRNRQCRNGMMDDVLFPSRSFAEELATVFHLNEETGNE